MKLKQKHPKYPTAKAFPVAITSEEYFLLEIYEKMSKDIIYTMLDDDILDKSFLEYELTKINKDRRDIYSRYPFVHLN